MGAESEVTPWVTMGTYDQNDCWHPFYYDDQGQRHDGWGWFDDAGVWCVTQGHYLSDGTWVEAEPVVEVAEADAAELETEVGTAAIEDEPVDLWTGFLPARDGELPRWVGTSAVSHGIFLLLAFTMPDAANTLELDAHSAHDRFVQMTLTDQQEEEEPETGVASKSDAEATEAAKHAGEEGRAGDESAPETNNRMAIRGPAENEDLELAKARNQEIAMESGIARQVMSMWATADQSVGSDVLHALGNVDGSNPGEARGAFGLGIAGDHPGGGGKFADSIGMGDVDTKGLRGVNGKCKGVRCGDGAGADLGVKGTGVPKAVVIPQPFKFTGGLDKEIIRRIVRQHNRELKACYESELQKNKRLGGELIVKFTITGSGNVVAAVKDGGTLDNAAVERCVTSRIRRWVFPEQDGMGVVVVRYPFRFSPGN